MGPRAGEDAAEAEDVSFIRDVHLLWCHYYFLYFYLFLSSSFREGEGGLYLCGFPTSLGVRYVFPGVHVLTCL